MFINYFKHLIYFIFYYISKITVLNIIHIYLYKIFYIIENYSIILMLRFYN